MRFTLYNYIYSHLFCPRGRMMGDRVFVSRAVYIGTKVLRRITTFCNEVYIFDVRGYLTSIQHVTLEFTINK